MDKNCKNCKLSSFNNKGGRPCYEQYGIINCGQKDCFPKWEPIQKVLFESDQEAWEFCEKTSPHGDANLLFEIIKEHGYIKQSELEQAKEKYYETQYLCKGDEKK